MAEHNPRGSGVVWSAPLRRLTRGRRAKAFGFDCIHVDEQNNQFEFSRSFSCSKRGCMSLNHQGGINAGKMRLA